MEKFVSGVVNGLYPSPVAPSLEEDMLAAYDAALFECKHYDITLGMWLSPYYVGNELKEYGVDSGEEVTNVPLDNRTEFSWLTAGFDLSFKLIRRCPYGVATHIRAKNLQGIINELRNQNVRGTFNAEFYTLGHTTLFSIVL